MSEKLNIYNLEWDLIGIQDRKDFYSEAKEEFASNWKITKKVHTIRVLIMSSLGRIILQKRSRNKSENPWLYDKTIWWHIIAWDSADNTVIKECAEELSIPTTIVSHADFSSSLKNTKLDIIGILKHIDYIPDYISERVLKDKTVVKQPHTTSLYIGYYDGKIQFVDWESCWIETFSLEELEEELEKNPDNFTQDIHFMIKKYRSHIIPLKK